MKNIKTEWEKFGRDDPYYGVITLDEFRKHNLDKDSFSTFFKSGTDHIQFILEKIQDFADLYSPPTRALDFGCGVGRCLIPLASVYDSVVGTDISSSMLREAKKKCSDYNVTNVELLESDDNMSVLNGEFDLIHSFAVFQHIPPKRGERIFLRLIDHLAERGVAVVEFLYDRRDTFFVKVLGRLRRQIPLFHNLVNLFYGHAWSAPLMEKNTYNLNRLFAILHDNGCKNIQVLFLDLGKQKFRYVIIFAQKKQVHVPFESFYES